MKFSSQELALLAAIHEDPRSDIPRLVYADWLDENGQVEYAEFVRLQCAHAAEVGDWSACDYTPRERALLKRFGVRWRGQRLGRGGKLNCYPKTRRHKYDGWAALDFIRFHRGLPEVAHCCCNDDISRFGMDNVAESMPPHFQLLVSYTFYVRNGRDPALHLRHPIMARAQRLYFHALVGGDSDDAAPLPHDLVELIIELFRNRKLINIHFGPISARSKRLIKNELSPHVPTLTPTFPS
jgi:uncharacterized protein (TIGR02996 family)